MKKYRVYDCYGHNVAVFFEEKDASDYCNWKNWFFVKFGGTSSIVNK